MNLQIVAGILAIFFLTVAVAKSIAKAAAKREALRKSAERSGAGASVSLHNPYPGKGPEVEPAEEAPAEDAPAVSAPADVAPAVKAQQPETHPIPAATTQLPPHDSIYKWN